MKQTFLFCLLFVSLFSSAQIINIPDANFKAKLLAASPSNYTARNLVGNYVKIDTNNDNQIQQSEALDINLLSISYSNISSLEGVNYFSNLSELVCNNNQLTSLNVSTLNNLTRLDCFFNSLSNLNVNGLTNLTFLNCPNNQLTSLNVNTLTNLTNLYCNNNLLTSLNFEWFS